MTTNWLADPRLEAIRRQMRAPQERLHDAQYNLQLALGSEEDGIPPDPALGDEALTERAAAYRALADLSDELAAMRRVVRAETAREGR